MYLRPDILDSILMTPDCQTTGPSRTQLARARAIEPANIYGIRRRGNAENFVPAYQRKRDKRLYNLMKMERFSIDKLDL